jgi:hypothetical protein
MPPRRNGVLAPPSGLRTRPRWRDGVGRPPRTTRPAPPPSRQHGDGPDRRIREAAAAPTALPGRSVGAPLWAARPPARVSPDAGSRCSLGRLVAGAGDGRTAGFARPLSLPRHRRAVPRAHRTAPGCAPRPARSSRRDSRHSLGRARGRPAPPPQHEGEEHGGVLARPRLPARRSRRPMGRSRTRHAPGAARDSAGKGTRQTMPVSNARVGSD